jgi:hypothetical protein
MYNRVKAYLSIYIDNIEFFFFFFFFDMSVQEGRGRGRFELVTFTSLGVVPTD